MKTLLILVLIVSFEMVYLSSDLNEVKAFRAYFVDPVFFRTNENQEGDKQQSKDSIRQGRKKGSSHKLKNQLLDFVAKNESELKNPYPNEIYQEYVYGDCINESKQHYASVNIEPDKLVRRAVIRGWLKIRNLPTCVVITGRANIEHISQTIAFNFQICVARITYIYSKRGRRYYYYEWYIPKDLSRTFGWNIQFYGPDKDAWGYKKSEG